MKKNPDNKTSSMFIEESVNDIVAEATKEILREAIVHFNTPALRKRGDTERFFFSQEEVDFVLSQLYVPESVICTIEKNFDGSVFCWCLDYNFKNTEAKKKLIEYCENLKAEKKDKKS